MALGNQELTDYVIAVATELRDISAVVLTLAGRYQALAGLYNELNNRVSDLEKLIASRYLEDKGDAKQ